MLILTQAALGPVLLSVSSYTQTASDACASRVCDMPREPLMVMTVLGQNAPYYPGCEGGRSEQASGVASLRCSPDVEDGKEVGRSKEDARVRQHSSRAESVATRSHPW